MNHASHGDGSVNRVIHKQFNASVAGTDFIAQSSDGVIFYLHRKNLQVHTNGAFPGLHDPGNGADAEVQQIIRLDEPSSVLEIVFQFIYPRRNPSLKNLGFDSISEVADAVEKYKVFAAMDACEAALRVYLPDQALPIFLHALRYRQGDLVDECAKLLSRGPLFLVLKHLPAALVMPWLRYLEVWKEMFDAQLKQLEGVPQQKDVQTYSKTLLASCSGDQALHVHPVFAQ